MSYNYFFIADLTQEGIFRKTGSLSRQNELKIFLYQNEDLINLNDKGFTAHDCASVLKSVLADFPEPLLTEVYYPAYCQVAGKFKFNCKFSVRLLHCIICFRNL